MYTKIFRHAGQIKVHFSRGSQCKHLHNTYELMTVLQSYLYESLIFYISKVQLLAPAITELESESNVTS